MITEILTLEVPTKVIVKYWSLIGRSLGTFSSEDVPAEIS